MTRRQNFPKSGCLLDMPCGCKLRVDELTGNLSTRSRLYSLGILPGTELEVCSPAKGSGNVCIRVRQCSLVLDEDVACGIRCCRVGKKSARTSEAAVGAAMCPARRA